jgi:hypothetical protein
MFVYLNGDVPRGHPNYQLRVAPAADPGYVSKVEMPSAWKEADGSARQIDVIFAYGKAAVDDNLGDYLVTRGICERSKLVKVVRNLLGANSDAD